MKTKEEVLIKLGEQTKKVNVEFVLVDDLKKQYEDVKSARFSINDALKKANDASLAVGQSGKSLSVKADAFLQNFKQFEGQAKALGLDTPSDLKTLALAVKGDVKTAQSAIKAGNSIANAIKI